MAYTPQRAVVGIVKQRDRDLILVGKKRKQAKTILSGRWHLPGEKLKENENDIAALQRGIREEAGIEIVILRHLGEHTSPYNTAVNWYECIAQSNNIHPGSDLKRTRWIPKEDVARYSSPYSRSQWPEAVCAYFGYTQKEP